MMASQNKDLDRASARETFFLNITSMPCAALGVYLAWTTREQLFFRPSVGPSRTYANGGISGCRLACLRLIGSEAMIVQDQDTVARVAVRPVRIGRI